MIIAQVNILSKNDPQGKMQQILETMEAISDLFVLILQGMNKRHRQIEVGKNKEILAKIFTRR